MVYGKPRIRGKETPRVRTDQTHFRMLQRKLEREHRDSSISDASATSLVVSEIS